MNIMVITIVNVRVIIDTNAIITIIVAMINAMADSTHLARQDSLLLL